MHFVEKKPEEKRKDFVTKLKTNKILRIPGAYNPITAKIYIMEWSSVSLLALGSIFCGSLAPVPIT